MLYCDTSFLAPLFLEESASPRIEAFVRALPAGNLGISHWTRVEFSSLLAREVRMGGLSAADALAVDREGSCPRFLDSLLRCSRTREGGRDEAQAVQSGIEGESGD